MYGIKGQISRSAYRRIFNNSLNYFFDTDQPILLNLDNIAVKADGKESSRLTVAGNSTIEVEIHLSN